MQKNAQDYLKRFLASKRWSQSHGGWCYMEHCHIERTNPEATTEQWCLTIGNQSQTSDDLPSLELELCAWCAREGYFQEPTVIDRIVRIYDSVWKCDQQSCVEHITGALDEMEVSEDCREWLYWNANSNCGNEIVQLFLAYAELANRLDQEGNEPKALIRSVINTAMVYAFG